LLSPKRACGRQPNSPRDLDRVFARLLAPGIDFGDLYFQHSRRESWSDGGRHRQGRAHSIEQGVGVRAISGEKTGFAYSDEIRCAALLEAAGRRARSRAMAASMRGGAGLRLRGRAALYPAMDPIDALANEAKVELLLRVDALVRNLDPRVQQVMVSLSGGVDTVLVARSDGVLAGRRAAAGADATSA
jgi:TldD protein